MIYNLNQQNEIWEFYFVKVQENISFRNPLRADKTPKCYFKNSGNKIFFIDWAFKKTHLDCIEFVSHSYNLDNYNAIIKINSDLNYSSSIKGSFNNIQVNKKGSEKTPFLLTETIETPIIKKPIYSASTREFQDYDFKFWEQFNISKKTLNRFNVKALQYVFKNDIINYSSSKYTPIYGYFENDILYKIYNPLGNKVYKWRTIKAILEGYSKLEYKTNTCFITSSLKDTMLLDELNFDAFNLPSENSYKNLLPIIDNLFLKFDYVYIYLNNDETGKDYSKILTLEVDKRLKYINNPSHFKETDPSDIVKNYSVNELFSIIKEKFIRDKIIFKRKK